jgi:hypothetical protein
MVTQLFGITMSSDPLANAVAAFEVWRINKKGKRTPAELRQQAVALTQSYSANKITKSLRLSRGQFKIWCQQSETTELPTFVKLPSADEVALSPSCVEVFFNSGERLCLNGSDTTMLSSLVQALKT